MKTVEGLRYVQAHFPAAMMPLMVDREELRRVSEALHRLAMKRPAEKADLIRAMDEEGLGVYQGRVTLF